MPSDFPEEVVAAFPFEVFQLAHPFIEWGLGHRLANENDSFLFVETYFFSRPDTQFFTDFFGNCHLALGR